MSIPSWQIGEPIPKDGYYYYAMAALGGFFELGSWESYGKIPDFMAKTAIEVDEYIADTFPHKIPSQLRPETLQRAFSELRSDAHIRNDLLPLYDWMILGKSVGFLTERPTPRTMKIAWIQKTKADQYGKILKAAPPQGNNTCAFDAVLFSLTALKVGLRRIDIVPSEGDETTPTQHAARIYLETPFPSGNAFEHSLAAQREQVIKAYFNEEKEDGSKPRPYIDVADLLEEIGSLYASMLCFTIRRVACFQCGKIRDDKGKEVDRKGGRSKLCAESQVVLKSSIDATQTALDCQLVEEETHVDIGVEISTVFYPNRRGYASDECLCCEKLNQGPMPLHSWRIVGDHLPPFLFFSPSTPTVWADKSFRGLVDILYCREANGKLEQVEESYQLCQVFCLANGHWTLYARIEDAGWVFFDSMRAERCKELKDYSVEDVWREVRTKQSTKGLSIKGGGLLLVFAHVKAASGYVDPLPGVC